MQHWRAGHCRFMMEQQLNHMFGGGLDISEIGRFADCQGDHSWPCRASRLHQ